MLDLLIETRTRFTWAAGGYGSLMQREPLQAVRSCLQHHRMLKSRTRSLFLFVVLPAWLGPGLLDWYFHRRSHIEEPENGGALESLVHSTMFVEGGLPLLISASFEMNPLVIALMTGAAALHELTAMADVSLALRSSRRVSQWEQHVHSFLEVMPFGIVPLMTLLHSPMTKHWRLTRRSSAFGKRDVVIVASAIAAFGVLPYTEELARCLLRVRQEANRRGNVEMRAVDGSGGVQGDGSEYRFNSALTPQETT